VILPLPPVSERETRALNQAVKRNGDRQAKLRMTMTMRMIPGAPASLSKNPCIGFAEFNELNEGLNEWLSGKKEALLLAISGILT
jgi:hypothetical protein